MSCRPAGIATSRSFPPTRKASPVEMHRAKYSTCLRKISRGFLAVRRTSGHPPRPRSTYEGAGDFEAATPGGKNLHFGIREHAMGAILNGMSLSKLRPFGATFFIFSDYARPAIRLASLNGAAGDFCVHP